MPKKQKYAKPEAKLRDFLAGQLGLIEDGLTLVQKEYPLQNPEGAKGFIDILARDIFGHRVVIEIKRSDATARQALHELHKYVELLQKNQGLTNAEVRCILVSTDWHELRVPFGAYQRTARYPVEGYEVVVAGGKPIQLQRVDPVNAPSPLRPFRVHHAFLFMTKKKRAAYLPKLKCGLKRAGVSSAIVLLMGAKDGRDDVVYPFCLYLMICDLTEAAKKSAEAQARREVLDPSSPEEVAHMLEQVMVCRVMDAAGKGQDTSESSWPEKLAGELPSWNIEEITRTGRLLDDHLVTDDDIRAHLLGHTGTGLVSYNGVASPAFPAAWEAAKANLLRCLTGNDAWAEIARYALALIESTEGRVTAAFHLYNPCDSVMMLYQLCGNDDPRFIPEMEICWKSDASETRHIISGVIGWDGKRLPKGPKRIMRQVFHGDDMGYFLARTVGEIAHFDGQVMKRHGLAYHAAHFVAHGGKDQGFWCVRKRGGVEEQRMTKRPARRKSPRPLPQFLLRNANYLNDLVAWFRSSSYGA